MKPLTIQDRLVLAYEAFITFATIHDLQQEPNRSNHRRLAKTTIDRFRHANMHSINELRHKHGLKDLTLYD